MDYTVGELAKRSGLTVRALHHYEQLGLLRPSGRTEANYRLYSDEDVLTLHRILAYRQMGLPLKDIGPLLAPGGAPPLLDILERQIDTVRQQLAEQQRLLATLERVARRARQGSGPELTNELLDLMSTQRIFERHYSPEDMDRLRAVQDAIGPEQLQRIKAETAELLTAMRHARQAGLALRSPEVLALSRRWRAIGDLLGVDDPQLRDKGRAMFEKEPAVQQLSGIDAALMRYIDDAIETSKAVDAEAAEAAEATDARAAARADASGATP